MQNRVIFYVRFVLISRISGANSWRSTFRNACGSFGFGFGYFGKGYQISSTLPTVPQFLVCISEFMIRCVLQSRNTKTLPETEKLVKSIFQTSHQRKRVPIYFINKLINLTVRCPLRKQKLNKRLGSAKHYCYLEEANKTKTHNPSCTVFSQSFQLYSSNLFSNFVV